MLKYNRSMPTFTFDEILRGIENGAYANPAPYPNSEHYSNGTRDTGYRGALQAWKEEDARLSRVVFRSDLASCFGLKITTGETQESRVWNKAWEDAPASGLPSVAMAYQELAEMIAHSVTVLDDHVVVMQEPSWKELHPYGEVHTVTFSRTGQEGDPIYCASVLKIEFTKSIPMDQRNVIFAATKQLMTLVGADNAMAWTCYSYETRAADELTS